MSSSQTMLPESTKNDGALVAFVGTLGYGLTWAGSIVVNPMISRVGAKGARWISVSGVLCMSLGFALASLSRQASELFSSSTSVF